jgi:hypothetical protein
MLKRTMRGWGSTSEEQQGRAMESYTVYVCTSGAGFRLFCTSLFVSDAHAADFALQLSKFCKGVDIWRGKTRVLLLSPHQNEDRTQERAGIVARCGALDVAALL